MLYLLEFVKGIDTLQKIGQCLRKAFTLNVKILLLSGVIILSLPGLLYAQTNGEYEHDGFLLRYQLGIGVGNLERNIDKISGGGGGFSTLQLGYSLNSNWAVHGGLSYAVITGNYNDRSGELIYAEYTTFMPTLGISFYIMPINIYISPELHFAGSGTITSDTFQTADGESLELDGDLESGTGFGLRIGKEWWVNPDLGLGVAFFYSRDTFDVKDCIGDCKYDSTLLFGVAFSATYNFL